MPDDQKPPTPAQPKKVSATIIEGARSSEPPAWDIVARKPEGSSPEFQKYRVSRAEAVALYEEYERLVRSELPVPPETITALARAEEEMRIAREDAAERYERDKAAATADRQGTNQLDEFDFLVREGTALMPYVDPRRAIEIVIGSDILSVCVATMAKNIGGHGFELDCHISDDDMEKLDQSIKDEIEAEKKKIERFFRFCNPQMSFLEIRRRSTANKESTGYVAWELLKNGKGEIVGIQPMDAWTIRLTPLSDYIDSDFYTQDDDFTWQKEEVPLRYRMVLQMVNGRYRYYRQLGDPRVINAYTGQVYAPDDPRAKAIQGSNEEAHDVLFFYNYGVSGGITPYGIPRWMGAVYSAVGRRTAAEINLLYFDNKAVPPLVVLVSGGQLTSEAQEQIKQRIASLKGRDAFHDVLILEALQGQSGDPMDAQGRNQVRINLVPMNGAQEKDALFKDYSKDAQENVRMTFQIPPILLGLSQDYNRATAECAKEVADQQVFQPERELEDHLINALLFPRMGIRYWSFRSLAAHVADEDTANEVLQTALTNDVMNVDEARKEVGRLLGRPLKSFGEEWSTRPISINKALALAGVDFTKEGADFPKPPAPPPPGAVPPGLAGAKGKLGQAGQPKPGTPKPGVPAPGAAQPPGGNPSKQPAGAPTEEPNGAADGEGAEKETQEPKPGKGDEPAQDATPAKSLRYYYGKLPEGALEGAQIINGILRFREDVQRAIQQDFERVKEEERAAAAGALGTPSKS